MKNDGQQKYYADFFMFLVTYFVDNDNKCIKWEASTRCEIKSVHKTNDKILNELYNNLFSYMHFWSMNPIKIDFYVKRKWYGNCIHK